MERWNETEATKHKGTNRTTDRKGNQGKVERCKGKQGQGKERKRKQMEAAAKELDFIVAAKLRDEIKTLKEQI